VFRKSHRLGKLYRGVAISITETVADCCPNTPDHAGGKVNSVGRVTDVYEDERVRRAFPDEALRTGGRVNCTRRVVVDQTSPPQLRDASGASCGANFWLLVPIPRGCRRR
jgi:hypothetical protein